MKALAVFLCLFFISTNVNAGVISTAAALDASGKASSAKKKAEESLEAIKRVEQKIDKILELLNQEQVR